MADVNGRHATPASLLERLRQPGNPEAWGRFVTLYTPLLYSWARQVRLQEQDAADLVQDVFAVLLHKLPEFKYDPTKSFRAWLRTVMLNKWRDSRKRRTVPCVELHDGGLSQIAGPDGARGLEESEFRQYLVRRTLRLIQPEFQAGTWKAFQEYLVAGRPATEVARRAGISLNALYLAKSHVLRRLREELDGLLD